MSLTIELPPEMERQLRDEAAREGQDTASFARALLEERLAAARRERARRVAALLDEWDAEDAANPDQEPFPSIPPVSLREVPVE
jgi:hypothetical protein